MRDIYRNSWAGLDTPESPFHPLTRILANKRRKFVQSPVYDSYQLNCYDVLSEAISESNRLLDLRRFCQSRKAKAHPY